MGVSDLRPRGRTDLVPSRSKRMFLNLPIIKSEPPGMSESKHVDEVGRLKRVLIGFCYVFVHQYRHKILLKGMPVTLHFQYINIT